MVVAVPTFTLLDGKRIPVIGWGNGTGDAKKTAIDSGLIALKVGLRHIDTAQGYDNEKETGECIAKSAIRREDIWVTSKLSQEGGSAEKDPIKLSEVRDSVQETISRLGFQPDLLLVHNPFVPEPGKAVEFWQILEDMVEKGELKSSLGVSNYRPQDLEELLKVCKIKPVVNQIEYHPMVLSHLKPVLDIHAKHGIVTAAYGPLSPLLRYEGKSPITPVLERIAERLSKETGKDVDPAVALLLWTRAKGVIAVTASGNEGRITKLAQTQDLPDLTAEEVKEIEEIGKKYHFRAYTEHMTVDYPSPDLPSK